MKITLVEAYNPGAQIDQAAEPAIPIGLLSLAAIIEKMPLTHIDIVPLNIMIKRKVIKNDRSFHIAIANYLKETKSDIVGFQTICNSYHVVFKTIKTYKKLCPNAIVLLGGPQASMTDLDTLKWFPEIDLIFRGEAEQTFPRFLDQLRHGNDWNNIQGITFRMNGRIKRNPLDRIIANMDELPLPAYDLYPTQEFKSVHIDSGRGCPFNCIYCSTSSFFCKKYRTKSPERLVLEIEHILKKYGITDFHMTHDLFALNKENTRRFCQLIRRKGLKISWYCMMRPDIIDRDLIDEMIKSGLNHAFFGIESGSPKIQRVIQKRLNLRSVKNTIKHIRDKNILVTSSFVVGFPEEDNKDISKTLELAQSCTSMNGRIQINTVQPFAGSKFDKKYSTHLKFDHYAVMFDASLKKSDIDMIKTYPSLFSSFYYAPSQLNHHVLKSLSVLTSHAILLKVIYKEFKDPLQFFEMWYAWRIENGYAKHKYKNFKAMGLECNKFIEHLIKTGFITAEYFRDVLDYFKTLYHWRIAFAPPSFLTEEKAVCGIQEIEGEMNEWHLQLAPYVLLKKFNYDVHSIYENLARDKTKLTVKRKPTLLAFIALQSQDETTVYSKRINNLLIPMIRPLKQGTSFKEILQRFEKAREIQKMRPSKDVKTGLLNLFHQLARTSIIELQYRKSGGK